MQRAVFPRTQNPNSCSVRQRDAALRERKRHCELKQSIFRAGLDCFVASLLAMTIQVGWTTL